jgi:hypothetical protein
MKDTHKPATSTTAKDKGPAGFTDEERAAMREHAQELKTAGRRGPRAARAGGEGDVPAKIAEMPAPDRALGAALGEVRQVDLPGGTVRYRERGRGQPVVFLHGIVANGDLWRGCHRGWLAPIAASCPTGPWARTSLVCTRASISACPASPTSLESSSRRLSSRT